MPFLTLGDPSERRAAYIETWKDLRVDGFVIDTIPPDGGEPLATLDDLDAPYVLFGRPPAAVSGRTKRRPHPREYGWVDVDNRHGMRLAVEHLLHQGHRKIAYLGPGPTVDHVSDQRWRGYEEAMHLAGARTDRVEASYDEQLPNLGPRLAKLLESEVTAVAAFSDDLAVELMRFAPSVGRRIGGDASAGEIAVVGYDNSEKARLGLTSVRQPVEQIGRHLVIALQERIRTPERPHQVVLTGDLVVRDSSTQNGANPIASLL